MCLLQLSSSGLFQAAATADVRQQQTLTAVDMSSMVIHGMPCSTDVAACLHTRLPPRRHFAFTSALCTKRYDGHRRRKEAYTTTCSYSGASDGGSSRLIMPGQQGNNSRQQPSGRPGSGSGLIMPGQEKSSLRQPQLGTTPVNNFRPPPGFMDSPEQAKQNSSDDPQKQALPNAPASCQRQRPSCRVHCGP